MNILLINPNAAPYLNRGLAYMATVLGKENRVFVADRAFHARGFTRYLAESVPFRPDITGISVMSTNLTESMEIASSVRSLYPQSRIIMGGVHPTLFPEQTIKDRRVDAVCIGEGEESLPEYIDALERGEEPDVMGVWHKGKDGRIHHPPFRPFYSKIDALPFPDWDYFDIVSYLNANNLFYGELKMISSRGCPYNCSFCTNPVLREDIPGRFYRVRSPENVVEEAGYQISKYRARGLRVLSFGDTFFGGEMGFISSFCGLYHGLKDRVPWTCQTRADIITEEWAELAAEGGCMAVSLGIESGDERIRNGVYNKQISDRKIFRAVKELKRNGITVFFCMMIAAPGEKLTGVFDSLSMHRRLDPMEVDYQYYISLPRTAISSFSGISEEEIMDKIKRGKSPVSIRRFGIRRLMTKIYELFYFARKGLSIMGPRFLTLSAKFLFRSMIRGRAFSSDVVIRLKRDTLYSFIYQDFISRKM